MDIKDIKIVADSSADMLDLEGVPFAAAPLKIITAQKEYVDDRDLDVLEMATFLQNYKGRSSTSCPNASDYLECFGDAKWVFCVTITATLSGSFNAARMAKEIYENEHPDRKVFVLNSLTAGPEIRLIVEKIRDEVLSGKDFDEVTESVNKYAEKTGLLFVLESLKNLANNGRVSPLVAKMAGILGIRMVGKASVKGDLEPLNKCRGEKKALSAVVEHLSALGLKNGRVVITHCHNEHAAQELKNQINKSIISANVEIAKCGGLCSFYAEKGGLLIGFEKV